MKTQRRHELHTNVLADWIGKKMEALQPYFGWIAIGAIALVLAMLAYTYFTGRSDAQMLDGWAAASKFGDEATQAVGNNDTPGFQDATKGLVKLVEEYSGTPLATFAEANLGDLHLFRGQTLMWTNRSEALLSFREAVARYNSAIGMTNEPLLKNRLRMNLATAYEWMFQVDDAKRAYQQVEGIYEPAAKQQIAALEKETTPQLFERLQKFQPAPPAMKPKTPSTEFGKDTDDIFKQFPRLKDLERPGSGADATEPAVQPTGADTKPAVQDSTPSEATK